jgi:hypothetical protein
MNTHWRSNVDTNHTVLQLREVCCASHVKSTTTAATTASAAVWLLTSPTHRCTAAQGVCEGGGVDQSGNSEAECAVSERALTGAVL